MKTVDPQWAEWARIRDHLKTLWVAAVLAFWITVAIQAVYFYLQGTLNLILLSIALGMLVLGVVLKTRVQLHLRKEPPKRPSGKMVSET